MDRTDQAHDADGDPLVVLAQGPKLWRVMRERDVALVLRGWPDRNVTLQIHPLGRILVELSIGDEGVSDETAAAIERDVAGRDH